MGIADQSVRVSGRYKVKIVIGGAPAKLLVFHIDSIELSACHIFKRNLPIIKI